jgi:hypothetical protein
MDISFDIDGVHREHSIGIGGSHIKNGVSIDCFYIVYTEILLRFRNV